ncbi:MAG: hypothetical protein Q4B73_01145 [Lachnospiraceae bacterium]|nr:hypothetical protein [Lachnospiraceae bacterium]
MTRLFAYMDRKNLSVGAKIRRTALITMLGAALIGFVAWLLIRPFALATTDWMICFIGYPAIITGLATLVHEGNHEFHDGAYQARNLERHRETTPVYRQKFI